jgi:hypothetical protein
MSSSQAAKALWFAAGSVVLGLWLLSRPDCGRGCRTVEEHLINHGIDEFLTGLLS